MWHDISFTVCACKAWNIGKVRVGKVCKEFAVLGWNTCHPWLALSTIEAQVATWIQRNQQIIQKDGAFGTLKDMSTKSRVSFSQAFQVQQHHSCILLTWTAVCYPDEFGQTLAVRRSIVPLIQHSSSQFLLSKKPIQSLANGVRVNGGLTRLWVRMGYHELKCWKKKIIVVNRSTVGKNG